MLKAFLPCIILCLDHSVYLHQQIRTMSRHPESSSDGDDDDNIFLQVINGSRGETVFG